MSININTKSVLNTINDVGTISPSTQLLAEDDHHILLTYFDSISKNTYLANVKATDIVDIAFSLHESNFYNDKDVLYGPRLSYSVGCNYSVNTILNRAEEMSKQADKYPILIGGIGNVNYSVVPENSIAVIQTRAFETSVYQTIFCGDNIYTRTVNPSTGQSIWNSTAVPTELTQVYWSPKSPDDLNDELHIITVKQNNLSSSVNTINTNIATINTNIATINTNIDTINTDLKRINGEAPFYYASVNGWTKMCALKSGQSGLFILNALLLQDRDGTVANSIAKYNSILNVCATYCLPLKNRETGGFMQVSFNGTDDYVISELCMRPKTLADGATTVGTPVSYVMTLKGTAAGTSLSIKEKPKYYDLLTISTAAEQGYCAVSYASVDLTYVSTYFNSTQSLQPFFNNLKWVANGTDLAYIYSNYGFEVASTYLYNTLDSCAKYGYRLYDRCSYTNINVMHAYNSASSYESFMLRCDGCAMHSVGTVSSVPAHTYYKPLTSFGTISFSTGTSSTLYKRAYIFTDGVWTTINPS